MHAWFTQLLGTYGYWAVALVVMGESLGLPVPGETLLLLGAASAGAGYLEVWGVIGAAAGGAIVGDSLGYALGRWGAVPSWSATGACCTSSRVILPAPRCFSPATAPRRSAWGASSPSCAPNSAFLAGLACLPYPSFLLWNAAGGCLWALTFGWLGATFGSQWSLIARWARRVGVLILGLLVLVGVAVLLGRYWREHAQTDTALARTRSSVPPLPRKSQP
jgi:membrane protein DedA with SNARE-associated domain